LTRLTVSVHHQNPTTSEIKPYFADLNIALNRRTMIRPIVRHRLKGGLSR